MMKTLILASLIVTTSATAKKAVWFQTDIPTEYALLTETEYDQAYENMHDQNTWKTPKDMYAAAITITNHGNQPAGKKLHVGDAQKTKVIIKNKHGVLECEIRDGVVIRTVPTTLGKIFGGKKNVCDWTLPQDSENKASTATAPTERKTSPKAWKGLEVYNTRNRPQA